MRGVLTKDKPLHRATGKHENRQLSKANKALNSESKGLQQAAQYLSSSLKAGRPATRKSSLSNIESLLATERPVVRPVHSSEAGELRREYSALLLKKEDELQLVNEDRERLQALATDMQRQLGTALAQLEARQA